MIDDKEAMRILRHHKAWYTQVQREHSQHRAFYADDAWGSGAGSQQSRRTISVSGEGLAETVPESRVNKTQVNLVRPWVTSFIASLYYRGVKFNVKPDERANGLEEGEAMRVSLAIQELLNRVFEIEETEDASERLFTMGLLYRGGVAFKVGTDPENELVKQYAEDRIWIEALPPYECVWDRKARSKKTSRYFGHLYQMTREEAESLFDLGSEEVGMTALADVIGQGFNQTTKQDEEDEKYIRILELTEMSGEAEAKGKKAAGEFTVWLLTGDQGKENVLEVHRGATPYNWPDGRPAVNIVPFISEPDATAPLDSYAPVKSVVELNHEYNVAASIVSEAFRRDSNRIILYLKDKGVSEEDIGKIVRGEDMQFIGVDAQSLDGLFDTIDAPPLSSTLLEYIKLLQDSVDRTQLIADFARGKAGEYLSATEVSNLVNYTETTIGRIRKRMDKSLSRVAQLVLRVLITLMKAKITVLVNKEEVEVTKEHLAMRWRVQVVDTASTPAAAAQKTADLLAAQPQLIELAAAMDGAGEAPIMATMAEAMLAELVKLMGLPSNFEPAQLRASAPPAAPSPSAEQPVVPQEGQLPLEAGLEGEGQIAESPMGQAIMAQAEAEAI